MKESISSKKQSRWHLYLSGSVQRFLDGIGVGCLSVSLGAKVQHIESRVMGFLLWLGKRPHDQCRGTDPSHTRET